MLLHQQTQEQIVINQHGTSLSCRQKMIMYSRDACIYVVSEGNDRHIGSDEP